MADQPPQQPQNPPQQPQPPAQPQPSAQPAQAPAGGPSLPPDFTGYVQVGPKTRERWEKGKRVGNPEPIPAGPQQGLGNLAGEVTRVLEAVGEYGPTVLAILSHLADALHSARRGALPSLRDAPGVQPGALAPLADHLDGVLDAQVEALAATLRLQGDCRRA